jgi:two-component system response regulator DesR
VLAAAGIAADLPRVVDDVPADVGGLFGWAVRGCARRAARPRTRPRVGGRGFAAAALRVEAPWCKVLIVTTFGRAGYLRRAMEAGALGFVVKDAPAEQLADAVRRVARGERVVDPARAAATLAGGVSPLTARERDALVAARDGATVADIAKRLFLSEGTVRNYLSSAISKTGTRNRMEALRVADENGWL